MYDRDDRTVKPLVATDGQGQESKACHAGSQGVDCAIKLQGARQNVEQNRKSKRQELAIAGSVTFEL